MLNLKSFFKQTSIYTLSTFLSRSISFLLLPFYSRVLSPADFGVVDILTVSCTLINMTIALEIHQAIARFYNDWQSEVRRDYVSTAFIFTVGVYTAFCFLLVPFQRELASFFLEDFAKTEIITAALILSWATGVYYFTQSQLRWQLKPSKHAITSIVFTLSTTALTVVLVILYNMGVLGVLYGLVFGNIVGATLSMFFARKSYGLIFSRIKLIEMVRYSGPLVFSSVSVFLSLYIDRIMIKNMLSLTDLGLFSIAYRFASIVGLLLVGVNSAITPLIYTHYKNPSTPKQLEQIFRLFCLGALVMFVSITILSRELLLTFTTDAYEDADKIIPFLVLTTIFSSMYSFTPGLFIANKTKIIAGINILVGTVNLLLNLLLVPLWGILGAAMATLAGYCISFGVYYYYNQKYYPIKFSWVKYINAFSLSLITIYLVSFLPSMDIWMAVPLKLAVVAVLGVVIFLILADVEMKRRVRSFALSKFI